MNVITTINITKEYNYSIVFDSLNVINALIDGFPVNMRYVGVYSTFHDHFYGNFCPWLSYYIYN